MTINRLFKTVSFLILVMAFPLQAVGGDFCPGEKYPIITSSPSYTRQIGGGSYYDIIETHWTETYQWSEDPDDITVISHKMIYLRMDLAGGNDVDRMNSGRYRHYYVGLLQLYPRDIPDIPEYELENEKEGISLTYEQVKAYIEELSDKVYDTHVYYIWRNGGFKSYEQFESTPDVLHVGAARYAGEITARLDYLGIDSGQAIDEGVLEQLKPIIDQQIADLGEFKLEDTHFNLLKGNSIANMELKPSMILTAGDSSTPMFYLGHIIEDISSDVESRCPRIDVGVGPYSTYSEYHFYVGYGVLTPEDEGMLQHIATSNARVKEYGQTPVIEPEFIKDLLVTQDLMKHDRYELAWSYNNRTECFDGGDR